MSFYQNQSANLSVAQIKDRMQKSQELEQANKLKTKTYLKKNENKVLEESDSNR